MLENKIEEYKISNCPICGTAHNVKIDVFRNILPNDLDKDIRVPEFKKIKVNVICPEVGEVFETEILMQEDIYSKIVKLKKADIFG